MKTGRLEKRDGSHLQIRIPSSVLLCLGTWTLGFVSIRHSHLVEVHHASRPFWSDGIERYRKALKRLFSADNALLGTIHYFWIGKSLQRPTYHIASSLFLRFLGLIYLIAFMSLWTQVSGLVGDHGILPVATFLESVQRYFGVQDPSASAIWNVPTLLWLSPHDGLLYFLCAVWHIVLADVGSGLATDAFVSNFVDKLFIIILRRPSIPELPVGHSVAGNRLSRDLLGPVGVAVKTVCRSTSVSAGDLVGVVASVSANARVGGCKVNLECMATGTRWRTRRQHMGVAHSVDYHYWTQPLPNWTSWYAAQLPSWFQKLSVIGMFCIELVLPWFIFGTRVLRYYAFGGITLLMLLIGITGNYNFFNLTTVALALMLLDDSAWPLFLQRCLLGRNHSDGAASWRWRNVLLVPFAGLAIVLGVAQLKEAIFPVEHPQPSLASDLHISQFVLVNEYGLFRRMTKTRPEIVIEGGADGKDWKPYEFRWKPGNPAHAPQMCTPHQPRLDWQMWFESLKWERVLQLTGMIESRAISPWFQSLVRQLLMGEPQVIGLLGKNPFPKAPPKYIRAVLYHYRFTTYRERRATGDWWHRDQIWVSPAWSLPPSRNEERSRYS